MRRDSLEKRLANRPSPQKLVKEGILGEEEVPIEAVGE